MAVFFFFQFITVHTVNCDTRRIYRLLYSHSYSSASELALSPGVPNGTSSSNASRITQPDGSPFRQVSMKPSLNTSGSSLHATMFRIRFSRHGKAMPRESFVHDCATEDDTNGNFAWGNSRVHSIG